MASVDSNLWIYNGEPVTEPLEGAVGFVYKITEEPTGRIYIGKKILLHKKSRPPLKGKKRRRIEWVESDWRTYYGSSDLLKEDVFAKGVDAFRREILVWCKNKKAMSYYETKHQFLEGVLEKDSFNKNILGKFYPKDIEGVI